jgi:hypothetical protein
LRTKPPVNLVSVEALGAVLSREPYDVASLETEELRDERRKVVLLSIMREMLAREAMSHRRAKLLAYHVLGLYEQGYVTHTDFPSQ